MSPSRAGFYGEWRLRSGVVPRLRDEDDSPPERLLQGIWHHQRLLRDRLRTVDGEAVRVFHPGFRSVEGGPDFRGAMIQVGEGPIQSGDVEVDLRKGGWRAHGHDRNPAFANVILHVVWNCDKAIPGGPPLLPLSPVLDAPLGELNSSLGCEGSRSLPEEWRGRCCAPLAQLSGESLGALLRQAAQTRLECKSAQFQARARQSGWDQALWEGMFRALGYKHNVWPMQHLAELRPRWSGRGGEALAVQARLLGLSGLLPTELSRCRSSTDGYVKLVWDRWWRERDEFVDCTLPQSIWRLHGLRPANHPQRRLALASRWAISGDLAKKLVRWCGEDIPDRELAKSLLEELAVEPDEFWSWHCTFRSPRMKRSQPLLGATRMTDLAVNVVLPWLWARAAEGGNLALEPKVARRYFGWPPAEDNSLLRLARQRLLGGTAPRALRSAAAQQGLIQIVRDFCEHSNALCENCRFPELAGQWKLQRAALEK